MKFFMILKSEEQQDPVIQRADNSIQWINFYPADIRYKS